MNIHYPYYLLGAEAYGTGTYDCGSFDEGCAAGTSTTAGDSGGLVNTGYPVLIPIALAAALIIAAVIMVVTKIVRKRKSATTTPQA